MLYEVITNKALYKVSNMTIIRSDQGTAQSCMPPTPLPSNWSKEVKPSDRFSCIMFIRSPADLRARTQARRLPTFQPFEIE